MPLDQAGAGWHTITVAHLADDLEAGILPPPQTFVITIDDGWADGYTYAAPILGADGFVATFFVIAGRIGMAGFLSPDQLRTLMAIGDEIGNHTLDQARLAGLPDARAYEIDSASATIAAAAGQWPETLAYPKRSYSTRAMAAVEACTGMKMAVIEGDSTWETWATRFATPRIRVSPSISPASLMHAVANPRSPAAIAAAGAPRAAGPTAAPTPGAAAPTESTVAPSSPSATPAT